MDVREVMKQKITKINWVILLFSFLIEIVALNIVLVAKLDISIYNEMYYWVKVNILCVGIDFVFIFFMLDFADNKKKNKNILKVYKSDVNLKIVKSFILVEVVKMILILVSLEETIRFRQSDYEAIWITFGVVIFAYYILYLVLPKNSSLSKKIASLRKNKKDLKIILIDGNTLPSSFDIEKEEEYKTSDHHLYVNIKKDLPELKDEKIKEFVLENTIAIIHEIEEVDNNAIFQKYKEQKINRINMFHIMAVKNYRQVEISKEIESICAIKICDMNSAIEYTENLFIINEKDKIKKSKYNNALRKIKNIEDKYLKNDGLKEEYIEALNIIYQYRFINRLNDTITVIPKESILFELYRNSYLHSSSYESILTMFDYITVMGKLVEYYLYAKNNPKFSKDDIFSDIIGDNPPIWNNQILINVCREKENVLYKNIREEAFALTKDEQTLLHIYLSYLLNVEIRGEKITFDGLAEVFRQFRNKVEAHGIINDANVYAVWNLTQFFAKMFSKIFRISELECEYKAGCGEVKIGYKGEEKVSMGKYVVMIDDRMCFIKDKRTYIDYLTGEIKSLKEVK